VLALSPNDRRRLSLLLDAAYPNGGAVTPEQTPADPPEQQASKPDSQQDTEHSSHAPIRQLLDSFDMPAYMRTRSLDLVAVNRPGRLLYAPVLEWAGARKKTVNLLEFAFLDQDAAQSFWPDWGDVITRAVSDLRTALEAYPNDPDLIGVVGTLTARSRLFCRMWIDQDLPPHSSQGGEDLPLPHRHCHGPLPHARRGRRRTGRRIHSICRLPRTRRHAASARLGCGGLTLRRSLGLLGHIRYQNGPGQEER
jgi:transcriptional regulator, XRE family